MSEAEEAMRDAPQDVFTLEELPRFKRCSAAGSYDHGAAVFVGPRPIRCALGAEKTNEVVCHDVAGAGSFL